LGQTGGGADGGRDVMRSGITEHEYGLSDIDGLLHETEWLGPDEHLVYIHSDGDTGKVKLGFSYPKETDAPSISLAR